MDEDRRDQRVHRGDAGVLSGWSGAVALGRVRRAPAWPLRGLWTNGVLAVRESFQAGRSHGVRTKWDIAGHRVAETTIREGKIEGWHREWHTNGQMSLEVSMSEGKPHGLSRKWNPEGALVGQWSLSNGVVQRAVTNTAELQGQAQQGGRL